MDKEFKYFIKGSGTSSCLITGNIEDQQKFIPLNIKFSPKIIKLSGLFAMAISQDDQIFIWGLVDKQSIQIPRSLKPQLKVDRLSCGWDHALFCSKQQLFGIGDNKFGQLGSEERRYISQAIIIEKVKCDCMRAGFRQSYWVSDNVIRCCGQSKNYELGVCNKKQIIPICTLNNPTHDILKIQCGKKFVLLLNKEGQVYGLGSNDHNCLGIAQSPLKQFTLIQSNVDDVRCGWSHTVFLKNERVHTYGRNNFFQLGRKTESEQKGIQIKEQIGQIVSGTQFSFAVSNDGNLYGWGWNQHSNIIEKGEYIESPVKIQVPENRRVTGCETYPAITIIKTVQQ